MDHSSSENNGRPLVLAQKNFQKHRELLEPMNLAARFDYIFQNNMWGATESISGLGSTTLETEVLRRELPVILRKLGVKSILDIPCGEFRWMRTVDFPASYIGADIVPAIISANDEKFSSAKRCFLHLDLTADRLPRTDLILCRDCLVHLSHSNIWRALMNIKESGASWLVTTHFLRIESNNDISDGDWRPLNLTRSPFNFPDPELAIIEGCREAGGTYDDKSLALWRIADLPKGDAE